ncbi:hypothetical protein NW759_012228 [Fusarium solani]|nr:hypothetical protein NW759_012228 [Fusarium solani]
MMMALDDKCIEALVSQLTLEEKLSLMAGASTWRTTAIPHLGIPNMKFSDGPSGARGEIFGESVPAAFFPSGVSLGATWDPDLLYKIGEALADECKTKSASAILAPTMCIHRHPLGGRNFESFSEDPYLTGKLASAHVRGVQSRGIAATPKHFVANDQETLRFKYDAIISQRALREVYLLPFQMVVREAVPWCMMTSYNMVNGRHMDSHKEILTDIVRKEWRWEGLFMSDWGGTNTSVESINAGLDLEVPGPPLKRSKEALEGSIKEELLDLKCVDASVRRLISLLRKTGRFQDARDSPEFCKNDPDINSLLLRAACAGIVMLKNEASSLPIQPSENIKKLAILGPNAKKVVAGGGGSSYIRAPYWTSVLESVEKEFDGTSTNIVFSPGAKANRYLPSIRSEYVRNPDTNRPGAAVDWFIGHHLDARPVATTHIDDLYFVAYGVMPPEIDRETDFSFRIRTILQPLTSGQHQLSLASIGPSKLFLDGVEVASQSGAFDEKGSLFFTYGSEEAIIPLHVEAGKEYEIRVDYFSHDRQLNTALLAEMDPMEDKFQGARIGYQEQDFVDQVTQAVALADGADAAIIVVGRDKEWETEGQDIPSFELPGEQVRLIEEVATTCKRTIVVVQAGTPVQMDPWISKVQAVLYTWYQGQELGNAAASVIVGKYNPSGRLPITFPKRIEDCPAFSSFPGEQGVSEYSEGVFVGYRWWDLMDTLPRFPLGFGLSYSKFQLEAGQISSPILSRNSLLTLSVYVRNTGGSHVPGRETVIAWSAQRAPRRLRRPKKQVCAFGKSPTLASGDQATVNLHLDAYSLGVYDPKKKTWIIDANSEFDILIGTTALNASPAWLVKVPEEITWVHTLS